VKNQIGVADYGMDVWDGGLFNLEARLDVLKACGIGGIEWLRAADMAEAVQNACLFHRKGMDFASCKMSTPELTLKCASAFKKEYVWIDLACQRTVPMEKFLRRSNIMVKAAEYYGLKVALHNHLGSLIEGQDELDMFMKAAPGVYLLLDIGHLHAAGGDCVRTVEKYHDRLAAVHFKDIFYKDQSIGLDRWWERLRFCELNGGNADLPLEAIAKVLQAHHYDKWLLIEQDTHLQSPEIDLKKSADILKELFY